MDSIDSLQTLSSQLAEFAAERNWDQFHNPKNLAMALTVEAGELLEHFQWLRADEAQALSPSQLEAVALEMADILMYLVRLSDKLDVDLLGAARRKLEVNRQKYPISKSHGRATKYDQL